MSQCPNALRSGKGRRCSTPRCSGASVLAAHQERPARRQQEEWQRASAFEGCFMLPEAKDVTRPATPRRRCPPGASASAARCPPQHAPTERASEDVVAAARHTPPTFVCPESRDNRRYEETTAAPDTSRPATSEQKDGVISLRKFAQRQPLRDGARTPLL